MVKELVAIQTKLVPDLVEVMKQRHQILHHILLTQPIGRRSLAQQLRTTERILRGEVEFLREQDLLMIEATGMKLTDAGIKLLNELDPIMRELNGISDLEERLQNRFGIPNVVIVPGDSDQDPLVKRQLGYAAAKIIQEKLRDGQILAITGGSTLAAVAEQMPPIRMNAVEVVPARGGIGERVELLANTIAATLAAKLGGTCKMLHVPDHLSEEAYQSLLRDPGISETLDKVRSANMVVHGIGQAITMAYRRNLSEDVIDLLRERKAVAEAFGYFFDSDGKIVYSMNSLGIRLDDLQPSKIIIAVAGGSSKAEAVLASARASRQDVLITDQACAEAMAASTYSL